MPWCSNFFFLNFNKFLNFMTASKIIFYDWKARSKNLAEFFYFRFRFESFHFPVSVRFWFCLFGSELLSAAAARLMPLSGWCRPCRCCRSCRRHLSKVENLLVVDFCLKFIPSVQGLQPTFEMLKWWSWRPGKLDGRVRHVSQKRARCRLVRYLAKTSAECQIKRVPRMSNLGIPKKYFNVVLSIFL